MTILVTWAIRSDCGFIQLFILLGPQWLPLYQPHHCVKLTSLIQDALEITLTHPAHLSAQRSAWIIQNRRRCHHFLKGSLQLEGTGTQRVAAHLYWQNLANDTLESVNMSTSVESSNKQHTMSNSSACVSVFSLNKDLTWLTTSARFMAVERMMLPWSQQRRTRGSGFSDISRGGNQRLHWPNNFCTSATQSSSSDFNDTKLSARSSLSGLSGLELSRCNCLLLSSKAQSNNEE